MDKSKDMEFFIILMEVWLIMGIGEMEIFMVKVQIITINPKKIIPLPMLTSIHLGKAG